jgi:hypothetical protein
MISFKQYLLEYLTDEQRSKYKNTKMTDKARSDTDHFFGKDNDIIHGEINDDEGHLHNKSEIHKAIERHLDKEISTDDYRKGLTNDKYGRPTKIGRLIKDPHLKDQFASDTTREGSKKGSTFKTSTVRGTEVAGQTNSAPDEKHPSGHSWGEQSCKNVDTGSNRHYLNDEIKHGTVVHRVHDQDGKEIYRATLQPHHNEEGHVAYNVESEYGIKHPAFTKSSHEVAKKLSGKDTSGVFSKHEDVYDDNGQEHMLHPNATKEDIDKILDSRNKNIRILVASHPNATKEHLNKALNDKSEYVREAAAGNSNATKEHLDKALNDVDKDVRVAAANNIHATKEHLDKALNDEDMDVRLSAIRNPNITKEHLDKALNDEHRYIRLTAAKNPNITKEHLDKALNDEDEYVRRAAVKNSNVTKDHLDKALNDKDDDVKEFAAKHPNATKENLDKALNDKDKWIRKAAVSNPNATKEHLNKALNDEDENVREAAAGNPNATKEHLNKALNDKSKWVREAAASNHHATKEHLDKALNDEYPSVREVAKNNPNYKKYYKG